MEEKPRSRAHSVIGQIKWWTSNNHFTNNNTSSQNNNTNHIKHFGSSVAVQKLRESKWFGPDESRIFCAVIECGFIVETREGQENDGWFGVVNCKTSKDKKPKPENIDIYTLKTTADKRCKVTKYTLADIWKQGFIIRINNFGDKEKAPHSEKDIKNQLSFAWKAKQMLWHNSQHFATWCRYGDRQQDIRRRQVVETQNYFFSY